MNDISVFSPHGELAYLYGKTTFKGEIRREPEDFFVSETLSFQPSGEGEHLFLWIEKKDVNTEWVAKDLAKYYSVRPGAVAWAGLKDKRAVTRQWFAVHLPGCKDAGEYPGNDQYKVLKHTFNNKKLRVGAIASNFFRLRVVELEADKAELERRLEEIKCSGVPNYFGEQRFGIKEGNLQLANSLLLENKRLRKKDMSMAISAARSYLFNQMLSQRIEEGLFNKVLVGDALMLSGTKSIFIAEVDELETLQHRLEQQDCHISCAMPGSGGGLLVGDAEHWEEGVLSPYEGWLSGLERLRVAASRRAGRLIPENMQWSFENDGELVLEFSLPTGAYATSVLREVFDYISC